MVLFFGLSIEILSTTPCMPVATIRCQRETDAFLPVSYGSGRKVVRNRKATKKRKAIGKVAREGQVVAAFLFFTVVAIDLTKD